MITTALLTVTLLLPQQPGDAAATALQQELADLVDRPTRVERERAAATLAARGDVTLPQWLAACAAFAPLPGARASATKFTASLQVGASVEDTELHVFVPETAIGHPAPLLLWGHGAGGSGDGQYEHWREVADKLGMIVLAPTEFGDGGGWGFTARERDAQLQALRWARRHYDIDENAVFVGGVSRGGHMTWDLLLRHPDLFAAALPCIGGPRLQLGEQNNLRCIESILPVPIRDLQGSQDDPLLLANLRLCFARLKKLGGRDQQLIEFADRGHDFDLAAVDWSAFLAARRQPSPPTIVRTTANLAEGRSGWLEILAFDRSVAETFELRVDSRWQGLGEDGQRAYVLDQTIAHTARIEATRTAPGKFTVRTRGASKARLLLDDAMLGGGATVDVQWQGRAIRRKVERSAKVLLTEFAERFDRRFLPVVEVTVP